MSVELSHPLPRQTDCAIADPREREAVCLLYQAGWSRGELALVFQCGESTISRLLKKEGVER